MTTLERQELAFHRAYLRAGVKLAGIRHRLELLESSKPLSPQQAEAKAAEARREQVDEFWRLSQAEQDTHPGLSAAEARQQVLRQHPDLRAIYPRIQ